MPEDSREIYIFLFHFLNLIVHTRARSLSSKTTFFDISYLLRQSRAHFFGNSINHILLSHKYTKATMRVHQPRAFIGTAPPLYRPKTKKSQRSIRFYTIRLFTSPRCVLIYSTSTLPPPFYFFTGEIRFASYTPLSIYISLPPWQ